MKKKTKLTLGALALGVMAIGLTSCTASFCSVADKSNVMYAYDVYAVKDETIELDDGYRYSFGVSTYYDLGTQPEDAVELDGFPNIRVSYSVKTNLALNEMTNNAKKEGMINDDYVDFWKYIDNYFLEESLAAAKADKADEGEHPLELDKSKMTYEDIKNLLIGVNSKDSIKKGYGYIKYCDSKQEATDYWVNWDKAYFAARKDLGVDFCPNTDFITYFKQNMDNAAKAANSCLASTDGFYGHYGQKDAKEKISVFMEKKDWGYAWSKGFFEGLLVYPIGWLIDSTTTAFMGAGAGVAQVLAILVITFLIRAIMMVFTINQTAQTAKMSEIQPEISKIQAKYPNANTNKSEQMTMATEMQALYKKYKIHPFTSILVMILQFPVFICVWGAMTGSAVLSSDTFLGLRLSNSVSQTLFDTSALPSNAGGWWTALVLFIFMAVLQVVSMLLPQWIQKHKQKKLAKLGRNPNLKAQDNKMKWFTIIMMVMIIIMGFSLASGMVIYWIAGSIWTIAQTLIIEWINIIKKNHKEKPRKQKVAVAGANGDNIVDVEVIPESIQAPTGKKKYKKGSKKE